MTDDKTPTTWETRPAYPQRPSPHQPGPSLELYLFALALSCLAWWLGHGAL